MSSKIIQMQSKQLQLFRGSSFKWRVTVGGEINVFGELR